MLDFPPLEATNLPELAPVAKAALDLAKIDLTDVALAQFGDWRASVAAATEQLRDVVLDLSTQSKIDEAKSLRFRVIGQPRADIRKVSKVLKSKLASVSKAIGAEEDAAVAAFDLTENYITPQIEAREHLIAEEKRIAAEKEAARVATIQASIDKIRGCVARAQQPDMTSERIGLGIAQVESIAIRQEDFAEFMEEAAQAKSTTLAAMLNLRDAAKSREDAAAALEAQRIENERIAAEQRAQAAKLAEQQRLLDEQAAKLAAQQKAIDDARIAKEKQEREAAEVADALANMPLADRVLKLGNDLSYFEAAEGDSYRQESSARSRCRVAFDAAVQQAIDQGIKVNLRGCLVPQYIIDQLMPEPVKTEEPITTNAHSGLLPETSGPCASSEAESAQASSSGSGMAVLAEVSTVRSVEVRMVKLGEIGDLLGFNVTADFLAGLGFPFAQAKLAKIYNHSDLPVMCDAIIKHVEKVKAGVME